MTREQLETTVEGPRGEHDDGGFWAGCVFGLALGLIVGVLVCSWWARASLEAALR